MMAVRLANYFRAMMRHRWLILTMLVCSTPMEASEVETGAPESATLTNSDSRRPRSFGFEADAHEVAVQAFIAGQPATFLIDTGVDPSALDLTVAEAHGLKQTGEEGAIEGVGNNAATAYPSMLPTVTIDGTDYGPIEVLVMDMSRLSARYGAPLAGILGYSLLKDHAIRINYPAHQLTLFDGAAKDWPQHCAKAHRFPLRFLAEDDHLIVVPGLTVNGTEIPAFIDTGSSNGLRIDVDTQAIAQIREALPEGRASTSVGARGTASQHLALLSTPVELGPFTLHDADVAMVHGASMPIGIGNRFFEALEATLVVDIPGGMVGIFQDCD